MLSARGRLKTKVMARNSLLRIWLRRLSAAFLLFAAALAVAVDRRIAHDRSVILGADSRLERGSLRRLRNKVSGPPDRQRA